MTFQPANGAPSRRRSNSIFCIQKRTAAVHRLRPILGLLLLTACSSPPDPSADSLGSTASPAPSELSVSPLASSTASPSPTPSVSVDASVEPAAQISVDELARTTVEDLSVRTEPAIAAERLGLLVPLQIVFVYAGPVEADGYTWYQLASLANLFGAACSSETPPSFKCTPWVGWAAATTPAGDRWLQPFDPDCPPGRDTATYLSLDAATRLACAGDDEWRLVTYLAPTPVGRGCYPVWLTDPFWMDAACALRFPQPVERETDTDTSIQVFIGPALGECVPSECPPFDELMGSWVEVVGHLDDPVAETCTSVLQFAEAPTPRPNPDLTVFRCRLNFVVSEITATTPPSP